MSLLLSILVACAPADLDRSIELLESLEERRITVDARDVTLEELLAEIQVQAGTPIRADWEALAGLGIRREDRVSLRLADAPAEGALMALLLSLGPMYERPIFDATGGQVVVTSIAGAAPMRQTELYDLRSLLRDDAAAERLRRNLERRDGAAPGPPSGAPAEAPSLRPVAPGARPAPDGEEDETAPGAGAAQDPDPPSPSEAFVSMLMEHLDPEGWVIAGGSRGRVDERDGVLYVTATPRIHRQLRDLLRSLRSLHPTALEIQATVVRVGRDALELARRRHEPGSAALVHAATAAPAEVLWRFGGPAAFGETLHAESSTGQHADAERFTLRVTPSIDAAAGVVVLRTEVVWSGVAGERSASTTSSAPLAEGAVLIDLGGDANESILLALEARPL